MNLMAEVRQRSGRGLFDNSLFMTAHANLARRKIVILDARARRHAHVARSAFELQRQMSPVRKVRGGRGYRHSQR
jgi:hypothetical protein